MEFATVKRNRGWRKRRSLKKRRSDRVKFEVRSGKLRKFSFEQLDTFIGKERLMASTMHANSFWENYTVAQEWQNRHSVTWWRTRCIALEYENQMLRNKLRSLASQNNRQAVSTSRKHQMYPQEVEEEEEKSNEDNENLEFHVNEEMMSFLEQSIRHKIELKKKREAESTAAQETESTEDIQGGAAWIRARNSNAKLLYGEASPTILAMETALQTTMDRHKDRAKPQLWPIIPLKP